MVVDDPIEKASRVVTIVGSRGGYISARSQQTAGDNRRAYAQLTARVPADRLDEVIDELGTLGTVDETQLDSVEVTTQVRDLEARIKAMQISIARLQALLQQSAKLSDIIEAEQVLTDRQSQLEQLQSQRAAAGRPGLDVDRDGQPLHRRGRARRAADRLPVRARGGVEGTRRVRHVAARRARRAAAVADPRRRSSPRSCGRWRAGHAGAPRRRPTERAAAEAPPWPPRPRRSAGTRPSGRSARAGARAGPAPGPRPRATARPGPAPVAPADAPAIDAEDQAPTAPSDDAAPSAPQTQEGTDKES